MARLRLYALTTVGGLSLVYELVIGAMSPQGLLSGLVWILIVIPLLTHVKMPASSESLPHLKMPAWSTVC
jgi:hypothetical protein